MTLVNITIDDTDTRAIASALRKGPSATMLNYVASIFEAATEDGEYDASLSGSPVIERMERAGKDGA